jgi:hypothetical protein
LYRTLGKSDLAKTEFDKARNLTQGADDSLYKKIANSSAHPPQSQAPPPPPTDKWWGILGNSVPIDSSLASIRARAFSGQMCFASSLSSSPELSTSDAIVRKQ